MTVVELPTAFPYLAEIGAIVDSGVGITRQLLLLVPFNACFVLPLILIIGTPALPRTSTSAAARSTSEA